MRKYPHAMIEYGKVSLSVLWCTYTYIQGSPLQDAPFEGIFCSLHFTIVQMAKQHDHVYYALTLVYYPSEQALHRGGAVG